MLGGSSSQPAPTSLSTFLLSLWNLPCQPQQQAPVPCRRHCRRHFHHCRRHFHHHSCGSIVITATIALMFLMMGWLFNTASAWSTTITTTTTTTVPSLTLLSWRQRTMTITTNHHKTLSASHHHCRRRRFTTTTLLQQSAAAAKDEHPPPPPPLDNSNTKAPIVLSLATTTNPNQSMMVASEPAGAHPLSSSSTATMSSAASLSQTQQPTLPSFRSLWVFTCTTMLIWLSEPMLSLVDTTVVGMTQADPMASVVQLAALGPATMLIDASAYVAFFLGIATTNQLAIARAKNNIRKLQTTTSQVLGVALIFGMTVSAIVFCFGRSILTWMAGQSATPQLLEYSCQYCYIRAAVAPIAIMGLVAQSVCLADLDTKTPGYAVVVASIVNVIGDISLVPRFGIAGAAFATAVAGVSATMILMRKVQSKMNAWRQREVDMYQAYYNHQYHQHQQQQHVSSSKSNNSSNADDSYVNGTTNTTAAAATMIGTAAATTLSSISNTTTTSAATATTTTMTTSNSATPTALVLPTLPPSVPLLSLPDRASFIKLVKLSGPIFFVMLGKIVCYSAMTLRATNFGILSLAGHNIMMRIYWFMACFGDSLGQTAQSYLPSVLFYKDRKWRRQLIQRLLIMAVCIGLGVSQVAQWILQNLAGMFTKDTHIIQLMAQQSTWMAFSLLLDPFIMLCEGCIIATRDLQFLVVNYTLTMGMLWALLRWTAQTSLSQVWRALFLFHGIRLFQFATRVYKTTLKKEEEGDQGESSDTLLLKKPLSLQ